MRSGLTQDLKEMGLGWPGTQRGDGCLRARQGAEQTKSYPSHLLYSQPTISSRSLK